jgi:hypothetical protein
MLQLSPLGTYITLNGATLSVGGDVIGCQCDETDYLFPQIDSLHYMVKIIHMAS